MRVISANIRNNPNMAPDKVIGDCKKVAHARPDAVFWQEIGERRDHAAIDIAFPESRFYHLFPYTAVPITLSRRKWKVLDLGYVQTHPGKADTSPDRHVVWAHVRRRGIRRNQNLVLMNTHYVSGAWNDKPKPNKAWRQQMWELHYDVMKGLIVSFHNEGTTVIAGGDFNRAKVDRFDPIQKNLGGTGIDKVFVIPYGLRVRRRRFFHVNLHSDHHAQVIDVRLG